MPLTFEQKCFSVCLWS